MEHYQNPTIATVFFGTHTFAATILQGLIDSPVVSVDVVVTQPDKPVGRKKELKASPVKLLARDHHIPVDQPASLQSYELQNKNLKLGVTAQYGLLIPKHILDAPTHGILNVHTSLLPKYRGASPIQSALIHGESETGVTIMNMDQGMDTGPILLQKSIPIDPDDTYLDVEKKLAVLGRDALLEAIPLYLDGSLTPRPQDEHAATSCRQLTREDGRIEWTRNASDVYNQHRGMTPWPGIWTIWRNKRIKLLSIRPAKKDIPPGTVVLDHDTLYIGCGQDAVRVQKLQIEGKRPMDAKTFINGHREIIGEKVH